jgi:oligopeptide transport system substrate-binding protein
VPTDTAKLPGLFNALGVSAPDERTVKFQLTKPTPYFHTLAGIWVMFPAKQSSVDKGGENWAQNASLQIGNGPFQITKIDKANNLIEFKANQNYWQGRPKLDGVQYRYISDLAVALQAYKRGEIDIAQPDPNDLPTIKGDATLGKQLKDYPGACTETYTFNLTKPPFNNKLVRQAFAYGLDRDTYIHDVLKDASAKTLTWIPPGYPGYDANEKRFDFNADKAKQLLAKAGFPNGQGLPEIKYSYSSSNPANLPRAEFLAQLYAQNLGVTLKLDPVESKTLVRLRKDVKTFPQMTGGGWCADYPDPQDWLSIYWHSRSSFAQDTGYKNAQADKLMDQADTTVNETKRMQLYDQAQKMIIDDQGEIIRSNSKNIYLIKPSVKGFDFTPQDSDTPGEMTGLMNVTMQK